MRVAESTASFPAHSSPLTMYCFLSTVTPREIHFRSGTVDRPEQVSQDHCFFTLAGESPQQRLENAECSRIHGSSAHAASRIAGEARRRRRQCLPYCCASCRSSPRAPAGVVAPVAASKHGIGLRIRSRLQQAKSPRLPPGGKTARQSPEVQEFRCISAARPTRRGEVSPRAVAGRREHLPGMTEQRQEEMGRWNCRKLENIDFAIWMDFNRTGRFFSRKGKLVCGYFSEGPSSLTESSPVFRFSPPSSRHDISHTDTEIPELRPCCRLTESMPG